VRCPGAPAGRAAAAAAAAAALALAMAACGGEPPSPEAEIRATLEATQQAVREHRVGALKDLLAPDYADAAGRDRAALEAILTYHFLHNARIHVLVRVRSVEVPEPDRGRVEALVATAGRPLPGLEALADVDADLLWMDLGLARRDGDWQVTRAAWERASLEDLL